MKKPTWFSLSVIAAVTYGLFSSSVLAQSSSSGAADGEDAGFAAEAVSPQLPVDQVERYRVTYMRSTTTPFAFRSSTVISITNQSGVSCSTGVDWRIGFGGTACTTTLVLGPGQTGEHCSRVLPPQYGCNATCDPPLTNAEGSAIVGSSTTAGCSAIAVSARTNYTGSFRDVPISAITDATVVRIEAGNALGPEKE